MLHPGTWHRYEFSGLCVCMCRSSPPWYANVFPHRWQFSLPGLCMMLMWAAMLFLFNTRWQILHSSFTKPAREIVYTLLKWSYFPKVVFNKRNLFLHYRPLPYARGYGRPGGLVDLLRQLFHQVHAQWKKCWYMPTLLRSPSLEIGILVSQHALSQDPAILPSPIKLSWNNPPHHPLRLTKKL